MKNLIERYIYAVTQRLPEKERDEVKKELRSNIQDMLPDDANDDEITAVLYELGSPASLAEKYRQNPQYLISPRVYDEYIHVLKWIIPLVGVVLLIIGAIVGAVESIGNNSINIARIISEIFSKGLSFGISGAFQALVWTTVGFVIADRTGFKMKGDEETKWNVEDLPQIMPDDKGKIPLSDGITNLILTIAFSFLAFLFFSGKVPDFFFFQNGDTQIIHIFSSSFLTACIPAVVVIALFSVLKCISMIKDRRWTPFVCATTIISSLVSMGATVYLLNRADLFSAEFTAFVQGTNWGSLDLLRFVGQGGLNPIIIFISAIIVICYLAECSKAIYKTLKYRV